MKFNIDVTAAIEYGGMGEEWGVIDDVCIVPVSMTEKDFIEKDFIEKEFIEKD